ncbi:hypothetical protein VTJ83DRAFT_5114 [Remersonia thermophila]|uniref:Enoyl reductase (ER) domain-containing protein n=1 Tax=Remersonia thermophila TaxID=72144 RepID=A0ABR4DC25_9PEZI
MSSLPSEIKAVVITSPGVAEVKTVPLPSLPDDYILVQTKAVALNPTDWKHRDYVPGTTNTRVGCDYAGIVVKVGPKADKQFAPGDRVTGFVHGANKLRLDDGAFAEYIIAKAGLQIKTPDNLSDVEAATLGVGISTVAQGLYQALKLPLPGTPEAAAAAAGSPPPEILIYGGSTATGILGIQFAKLSGYRVATTSSPANFDYLKSLGADGVFDYREPDVAEQIRAWSADADGLLTLAWDCISLEPSARICAAALSRTRPSLYRALLPVDDKVVKEVNGKADTAATLAYTMFGEPVDIGIQKPVVPEDYEFGKKFWELSRGLLAEGKLKPARVGLNRGGEGLEGVLIGLDELKHGRVSGEKLVYTL